ncbi:Hypothetical protein I596_451 [Dokdonella koreensis DS-123]|uniref:Uncharacterized protein n=1 Tax=Dokdonella koreensis DS-123 TaxID=1300342 RepID=A0A167GF39_9GAMM|nr:Hypothetical protein I596_451 [Dokdonella koreensis DS-123]
MLERVMVFGAQTRAPAAAPPAGRGRRRRSARPGRTVPEVMPAQVR